MATIWMQSDIAGTHLGDRCVIGGVAERDAQRIVDSLNQEFADMGLELKVWVE